jgi:hypothetical protein
MIKFKYAVETYTIYLIIVRKVQLKLQKKFSTLGLI